MIYCLSGTGMNLDENRKTEKTVDTS
jgi:hypothetical protein